MTTAAARRLRLLRLRTVAYRTACIRLAAADAAHAAIVDVATRVAQLRAGIIIPPGPQRGRDLHALSELSARLDRAQAALAPSLVAASQARETCNASRIAAQLAEDRTQRSAAEATAREAAARDLRQAALQPHRSNRAGLWR